VAIEYKNLYKLYTEKGEVTAAISGKMMHTALNSEDYPAVGDWVVINKINNTDDRAVINNILPRKSKFSRKIAGDSFTEQLIATNIDIAFICMSLNHNFNLRRLERYITMAWNSGATPVIILTKADLCENADELLEQTVSCAIGIDVLTTSSLTKTGLSEIKAYIKKNTTVAFLGSSGVGKSTIINELSGVVVQFTQEVSDTEDKGKHTTTNRELLVLPEGGIVIDTPGMREFHITDVSDSIDSAFEDIDVLSAKCKFSDCTHTSEPTCAVLLAIEDGTLSKDRYMNYLKLKKEAAHYERKVNVRANSEYKKEMKKRNKNNKTSVW
jgi:ribosome biogenesis GTPase